MAFKFFIKSFNKKFLNFLVGLCVFEAGVYKGSHAPIKVDNEDNLGLFSQIYNLISFVLNTIYDSHKFLLDLMGFFTGGFFYFHYIFIIIFYLLIFYLLFLIYSIIHNFLVSLRPRKYEVITVKTLEENPNTVGKNLVEESRRLILQGDPFQKKELLKFLGFVEVILEKVQSGKLTHAEYILYSKLIYLLYFAVNKCEYFQKVPELHEPYKQSLSKTKIIINNSYQKEVKKEDEEYDKNNSEKV